MVGDDPDPQQPQGVSASPRGDILTVVVHRDVDHGAMIQDWEQVLIAGHPGPFREVHLDVSGCGRLNSTFYSGLIRLHAAFSASGTERFLLIKPDRRMLNNLRTLHFSRLFEVA